MSLYDSSISLIEEKLAPIAGKIASQKHVIAIKDGFISAMPFMIVGSFILIFAFPPFADDTTFAFGKAWLEFSHKHINAIMLPFNLTMGIMTLYVVAGIGYSLAKGYGLNGLNGAFLSITSFLIVAVPFEGGKLDVTFLGGTGIFTAIVVAIFAVELIRILKKYNLTIRLPETVPENIAKSFEVLVPIFVMIIILYPASLIFQHIVGVTFPQGVMNLFKPLVSASDSWGAVIVFVLVVNLLWFCGIHGASIVGALMQPFFLANLQENQEALAAGLPLPHVFLEPVTSFYINLGGSGATFSLVILYLFSRSSHLKSLGRLGIIPAMFNINEPIIFGSPIVLNPLFLIPWIGVALFNGSVTYFAMKAEIVARIVSLTPWTAPAPIGAMWASNWHVSPLFLILFLLVVDLFLWLPFFKVYEKQLIAQQDA